MNGDPGTIVCRIVIIFLAIGIHEYAHCKFADLAGDPTPRYYGRVTLNLFKHFEPTGTIMMILSSLLGYGIGWGRPAPMDPRKMRNPRWDFFIAVAAGPISNLCQAGLYGSLYRILFAGQPLDLVNPNNYFQTFIFWGVLINISLALFNLIPFGPLDGHYLVGLLLPEKPRHQWFIFNRGIGMAGLFVVVMLMQVSHINPLGLPVLRLTCLFIGQPLD